MTGYLKYTYTFLGIPFMERWVGQNGLVMREEDAVLVEVQTETPKPMYIPYSDDDPFKDSRNKMAMLYIPEE